MEFKDEIGTFGKEQNLKVMDKIRDLFSEKESEAIYKIVRPFKCLENAADVAECLMNADDYNYEVMIVEGVLDTIFTGDKKKRLDAYAEMDPYAAPFKKGESMTHYWLRICGKGKIYEIDPTSEKYNIIDCFKYLEFRTYKAADVISFVKKYRELMDSIIERAIKTKRATFSGTSKFNSGALIEYNFRAYGDLVITDFSVSKRAGNGVLKKVTGNGVYGLLENCLRNGVNVMTA